MNTEEKVCGAIAAYEEAKGALVEAQALVPIRERRLAIAAVELAKTIHGSYGSGAAVFRHGMIYTIGKDDELTETQSKLRILTD